ncbi:MAG: hypothetical protein QE271_11730 [Bacteriovoracaceae bacterium]|nr:hypothetical protein [Bacteriovoracaceae bacterium]
MKTKKLLNAVKGYWNDQSGQTSTEYILLIVVVVALISKFKAGLVGAIDPLINKIFGEEVNKLMGP